LKILSVVIELDHATRQTEMAKLIGAVLEILVAIAPNNMLETEVA
jgi:hypothetical protein